MKILISAYECAPNVGSESGVGWNWALQLALSGYEVWVITGEYSREKIEASLKQGLRIPKNLNFAYVDTLQWGVWGGNHQRLIRTHYSLWQIPAYLLARKLHAKYKFDLAHHLTWGVIRHPSYLGYLGIPFFIGPIGGGETAPLRLFQDIPWHVKAFELLRRILNYLVWVDPFMCLTFSSAKKIYCKTEESVRAIPLPFRYKAEKRLEIGCHPVDTNVKDVGDINSRNSLNLVFAGRLLHWKGLHIGMRALAKARQSGVDCSLTVIGNGPEKERLQALSEQLEISEFISWTGVIPQSEVFEYYRKHDALLFPSLHDSSGNVVLEAMSYGLPVICLNLGGPPEITGTQCGYVIRVDGKPIEQVADDMARAIADMAIPASRHRLGVACLERAKNQTWKHVVESAYKDMAESMAEGLENETVL